MLCLPISISSHTVLFFSVTSLAKCAWYAIFFCFNNCLHSSSNRSLLSFFLSSYLSILIAVFVVSVFISCHCILDFCLRLVLLLSMPYLTSCCICPLCCPFIFVLDWFSFVPSCNVASLFVSSLCTCPSLSNSLQPPQHPVIAAVLRNMTVETLYELSFVYCCLSLFFEHLLSLKSVAYFCIFIVKVECSECQGDIQVVHHSEMKTYFALSVRGSRVVTPVRNTRHNLCTIFCRWD
jgi:hypothetical protein